MDELTMSMFATREDYNVAKLEALMKRHDWTYEYSDDHRWWVAGQKSWAEISSVMTELRRTAKGAKACEDLLNKYSPWRKGNE